MDGIDKFEYPKLPPNATFYANLILSGISDDNLSPRIKCI